MSTYLSFRFRRWLRNENGSNKADDKQLKKIKSDFTTIDKIERLNKIIKDIKKNGYVAIDTETNSLNIEKAELVGISFSFNEKEAFYIPINHKDPNSKNILKEQISEKEVLSLIKII